METKTEGCDYKKVIEKAAISFAIGGITALGLWLGQQPPEAVGGAVVVAIVGAIIAALLNWLKHRNN